MSWRVLFTDEYLSWFDGLTREEHKAIAAAIELLKEHGPTLGRPLVDQIKGSRIKKMKELRPMIGYIRILFAFDEERAAILLVGGDKTNVWDAWYREMIPVAERLYDVHVAKTKRGKQR
jgi:hypothetical protein